MALVIACPLHPRIVVLQKRDLVGEIFGGGLESVVTTPNINTFNNTATLGGGLTVPTSTLASASTTASTASQTTTFITRPTTGLGPSETSSAASPTTSVKIEPVANASVALPGEITKWKVIGIAVMTITFITTVVLAITFFDSWWGFLRAVFLGDKRNGGDENLVPDWEKGSWEYNLYNSSATQA